MSNLQNTVNFIEALEANDKLFDFVPLPNLGHSFKGDGLVAALMASVDSVPRLSDRRAYDRDAGASGTPTHAGHSRTRSDPRDAGSRRLNRSPIRPQRPPRHRFPLPRPVRPRRKQRYSP